MSVFLTFILQVLKRQQGKQDAYRLLNHANTASRGPLCSARVVCFLHVGYFRCAYESSVEAHPCVDVLATGSVLLPVQEPKLKRRTQAAPK